MGEGIKRLTNGAEVKKESNSVLKKLLQSLEDAIYISIIMESLWKTCFESHNME